ncbi:MAG: 30S ribosomal protein S13 [Candidatus Dojkabacteria bacterium]
MARIAGIEIPNEKRVEIGLTYIFGIGLSTSQKILKATKVNPDKRVKELTDDEIKRIYAYIETGVQVEGQVRQQVFQAIKRLKDIRSYRGLRHKAGLPVRGQNTKSNTRTRKGKTRPVGGLAIKVAKK